jgi:hypothetical protein
MMDPMNTVQSQNGVPIRLSRERWSHILSRHPEMDRSQRQVFGTLAEPDFIQAQ